MQLVSRTLPCVLVLVMEGWADWLLVLPQFKAKIYVFCDGLPEESRPVLEGCGLSAGPWLPVAKFWDHEVLTEDSLCILVSGSPGFVEDCISRVPSGIDLVAASVHRGRSRSSKWGERLRWRTLRHQDVGGLTTLRCSLGFPREWSEFELRPHVQRRVKHVIDHSERPVVIKGDSDGSGLCSVDELLDYIQWLQRASINSVLFTRSVTRVTRSHIPG
jgi:hypothetical protein